MFLKDSRGSKLDGLCQTSHQIWDMLKKNTFTAHEMLMNKQNQPTTSEFLFHEYGTCFFRLDSIKRSEILRLRHWEVDNQNNAHKWKEPCNSFKERSDHLKDPAARIG